MFNFPISWIVLENVCLNNFNIIFFNDFPLFSNNGWSYCHVVADVVTTYWWCQFFWLMLCLWQWGINYSVFGEIRTKFTYYIKVIYLITLIPCFQVKVGCFNVGPFVLGLACTAPLSSVESSGSLSNSIAALVASSTACVMVCIILYLYAIPSVFLLFKYALIQVSLSCTAFCESALLLPFSLPSHLPYVALLLVTPCNVIHIEGI